MAAASSKDWKHTGMVIDIFTTFFLDHWLLENVCFLLTILVIPFGAPHYLLHCQKVLAKKIKCHYAGKRNLIDRAKLMPVSSRECFLMKEKAFFTVAFESFFSRKSFEVV